MPLPEGVRIRPLRRGDRDVFRLLLELGMDVPPVEQSNTLAWVVSHPESEVLLAVDPLDRGVGLISMSHRPQLRVGGRIATIDEFVVTAGMRHRGIGSALLERAVARAKMLGCRRIEVAAKEETSRDYMRKRGFTTDGATVMSWASDQS